MGAESDQLIQFRLTAEGGPAAAASIEGVAKSLTVMSTATGVATPQLTLLKGGFKETGSAAELAGKQMGEHAQQTRKVLSEAEEAQKKTNELGHSMRYLHSTLFLVSPALGEAASAMHIASAAGNALGQALGVGAIGGLVAGGLIGVLALVARGFTDAGKEAAAFAEEQRKARAAAYELADSLLKDGGVIAAEKELAKTLAALKALQGAPEKKAGWFDATTDRNWLDKVDEWGSHIGLPAASPMIQRTSRNQLQQERTLQEHADEERYKIQHPQVEHEDSDYQFGRLGYNAKTDKTLDPDAHQGGTPVPNARQIAGMATAAEMESQKTRLHKQLEMVQKAQQEQLKIDAENGRQEVKIKNDAISEEMRLIARKDHAIVDSAKQRDRELARLDAGTKKNWDEMRAMGTEAYTAVGTAGINTLQALAKGQHVSVREFISGIGDVLVAEGERYLFKGLAEAALGNSAGFVVAGIAASMITAGIADNAVMRPNGGSGGGGGGGSAPGTPITPLTERAGGKQPITVNISMPTVVSPGPQDAIRLKRAAAEGVRQGYT